MKTVHTYLVLEQLRMRGVELIREPNGYPALGGQCTLQEYWHVDVFLLSTVMYF